MQAELVATQWFIEHDHMKQQVMPAELLGQFSDMPNQNQANEALNGSFTVLCTHKAYK